MIITIDGPAGAGKSSVAKMLAQRLGFRFLDTGAMYRAIAWLSITEEIESMSSEKFRNMIDQLEIEIDEKKIRINGFDVTTVIRQPHVTARVSVIADEVYVRDKLVQQQREIAKEGNYVCEGRDQGTEVFPDSRCKIFLTASAEERAKRRTRDLNLNGEVVTETEILKQQIDRDQRDETRPVGRLFKADDAIEVVSDGMELDEVVDRLEEIARDRLGLPKE